MASDRKTDAGRRAFILSTGAAAATSVLTGRASAAQQENKPATEPPREQEEGGDETPSMAITRQTIAEAEKLAGVQFTDAERDLIAEDIGDTVQSYIRRRAVELPNGLGPAQAFDPRLPGMAFDEEQRPLVLRDEDPGPLPAADADIAFAPVTRLSRWIAQRKLSSTRLTKIYLDRLKRFGPKLECVITLTEELALEQAQRADAELAAGRRRSPLHGIPWGAKDLFDTAGIRTTWGAMPFKDRIAETDAFVVRKLEEAGAVLVAKLTLGALAYGDIWFDGKTRNPFNTERGSSGSSAGSAASTVAGLVGFSLGTETLGSIVSPCMRCGATGLRPTFGRVARTGAMALCWSLDKIGPICRTVEDCAMVLSAISGSDPGDPSSIDMPFNFGANRSIRGVRLGYRQEWFEGRRANDLDRTALQAAREAGAEMVEIELPDLPYGALRTILNAEAAAAFEELTLTDRDDELVWQEPQAWPNSFRQSRFIPAIEYIQAERLRRQVCEMMASQFEHIDAIIAPSYAGSLLLITNNTGHPSLTIRCGFRDNGAPHGITLIGGLFDEGALCTVGMALERKLGAWDRRPEIV